MLSRNREAITMTKLKPVVLAMVKKLIEQGHPGKKPFGIDLAVWKWAIQAEGIKDHATGTTNSNA